MSLAGCTSSDDSSADTTDPDAVDESDTDSSDDAADTDDPIGATLHTSEGDVDVELYAGRAPRTVENFVGLATGDREWVDPETGEEVAGEALYDDVLVHRVIDEFMIQTGDPTGTGRGGPGYQFDDEFHDDLRHDEAGVLSMANSGADTNGSQFFVTLAPQPHLDDRHSVFGKVIDVSASNASGGLEDEQRESSSGMDVVRDIGSVETDDEDRPIEDIFLESVTVHDA